LKKSPRTTRTLTTSPNDLPHRTVRPKLVANWETLQRVFLHPEDAHARSSLLKYMEQILFGLHGFLETHVGITREKSLRQLAEHFSDFSLNTRPRRRLAEVIHGIVEELAPYAVNVASPHFVGHMTAAIPFFMVHLQTIVAALNQNPVKLETSKVVSVYERQVLAKVHRLIFKRSPAFYRRHVQRPESTLGSFLEDGTLANLTALWVARNNCLAPCRGFAGVESEGMSAALEAYNARQAVVLVSRMGHHSLRKAGGVLGLGHANVLALETDAHYRLDTQDLRRHLRSFASREKRTMVIAVVGIAGATETGSIDDLATIGAICRDHGVHFHVDAAWGGPTLMSAKYADRLKGIQHADSVTVDGHKQFYMPMGCGMVYFREPRRMDSVAYHAAYVNRPGSVDLGIKSLVGSRPATSLILGSALDIMGTQGYGMLIDHGIETARLFAAEIKRRPLFELVTPPALNILTYRLCPIGWQTGQRNSGNEAHQRRSGRLNQINIEIQRRQREAGRSFVSRTTLHPAGQPATVVLRAVIMNPMTNLSILKEILDEQEKIYRSLGDYFLKNK
jgi:putative pyridoxal-dependent aspartate 1-decarboxylase